MAFDHKKYRRDGCIILVVTVFVLIIGSVAFFIKALPAEVYKNNISNYSLFLFLIFSALAVAFDKLKKDKLQYLSILLLSTSMFVCLFWQ